LGHLDHWHDVLVGSLLGLTLSYFSYRQYYPSLESELSHRPYSPRIKAELEELLPTHHHRPSHEVGITGTRPEGLRRRSDELFDDGLEGTVHRPEPDLEQLWKDGQDVQGRVTPSQKV
jgi:diacylglycerol diphosphate phosphatase / phosphatidate phosphatase